MFFHRQVRHRENFGAYLESEIEKLGAEAMEHMSLTSAFHDFWMDLKAFLGLEDELSLLKEALEGEQRALEDYDEVMSHKAIMEHPGLNGFMKA